MQTLILIALSQSKVVIYVGNPHKRFRGNRSAIDASSLLSSLAIYHPEDGWYVMSPMLSNLDPNDFYPVGQYLERGEYDPNLLDENTEWVRFERELTSYARSQEVVRCGTIYLIAQRLELPGLQALAFRKLKVLAKHESYQPLAILCVIEVVFASGKEDLRQYLVHYLADNYWDIVLAETKKAAEVMQKNDELAKGVFGLLCGFAGFEWADDKIEEEQETKGEDKGGNIAAPTPPEFSEFFAQAENQAESHVDVGLNENQQEMLKTAMRKFDEVATEKEIAKMMQ